MGHGTGPPVSSKETGRETLSKGWNLPVPNHPSLSQSTRERQRWAARQLKETFTTTEVARIVGRSTDTIRRWRKEGSVVPSLEKPMGELMVHVYTKDDVAHALEYAATVKAGRPPGKRTPFGSAKQM